MVKDQKVFLVAQKDPERKTPKQIFMYQVGTIAKVKQVVKIPAGYGPSGGGRN